MSRAVSYTHLYKNVINKAVELNRSGIDCQLAIETSGHAAYKENYFLDDGAYLATKIVIKAAQMKKAKAGLEDVLQSLKEPLESAEYRFSVGREDFSDYAQRILEDMQQWAQEDRDKIGISVVKPNYEGVRIRFDSPGLAGWCLMRKSLHDPKTVSYTHLDVYKRQT